MSIERFSKEKISVVAKIPDGLISELDLKIGRDGDDLLLDQLTVMLSTFIHSRILDEQNIAISFNPPTFFDWVFKRERKTSVHFTVKEVLTKNPNNPDETIKSYELQQNKKTPKP